MDDCVRVEMVGENKVEERNLSKWVVGNRLCLGEVVVVWVKGCKVKCEVMD